MSRLIMRRTTPTHRQPRHQDEIIHSLCAIWLLRIILSPGKSERRRLIWKTYIDDDVNGFLDIQTLSFADDDDEADDKRLSVRERTMLLKNRLNELEAAQPDLGATLLGTNIAWIGEQLGLSPAEQTVLAFAVLARAFPQFHDAIEALSFHCSQERATEVLGSALALTKRQIRMALSSKSSVVETGLIRLDDGLISRIEGRLAVSPELCATLLVKHRDVDALIGRFFSRAAPSELEAQDFPHLIDDLRLITAYLSKAGTAKKHGVNILLYGKPGVGKSQFARLVACSLKMPLYEVACTNRQGGTIDGMARFSAYMLSQRMLSHADPSLILFDEIEDVFPDSTPGLLSLFMNDDSSPATPLGKAWVNHVLESNPVPAIWISNCVSHIDPAYLRRFDLALEFSSPPKAVRQRIAGKILGKTRVSPPFVDRVAEAEALTPAQIEKAARVALLVAKSGEESEVVIERALRHSARLLDQPPLPSRVKHSTTYDLSFVNASLAIEPLIEGLRMRPSASFCFYGPPGTGKTALAHHLAASIGKPVRVKRASDLLAKYVGESEQNIAQMFREAADDDAVLLLDEADSLLADRRGATQAWEISQVNELLTRMEEFDGIFVCTTNLIDRLDPASSRRFAFKIRFDCLNREQRRQFFRAELQRLSADSADPDSAVVSRVDRLDRLTPGDFAAVARQWILWSRSPSAEELISALEAECRMKGGGSTTMGFVS